MTQEAPAPAGPEPERPLIPPHVPHKKGFGAHDLSKDPPLSPRQASSWVPGNTQAYVDEERVTEDLFDPNAGLPDRQAGRS